MLRVTVMILRLIVESVMLLNEDDYKNRSQGTIITTNNVIML